MYPDLPYPGYTWPLTQHMGVIGARSLYQLLWAAATYANSRDPAADINSYLIANQLLSDNVRTDTGQPEGWRDYQQILSERHLGWWTGSQHSRRATLTRLR